MADVPGSNPNTNESTSIDQADIDALFGATSSTPPLERGGDEISQADIDALLGGAGTAASEAGEATPPSPQLDSLGRPFDAAAAAMQAAIDEERAAAAASDQAASAALDEKRFQPPELSAEGGSVDSRKVTMLNDVNLRVRVELGRTRMLVEDVLRLGEGSVVELEKLAGDPVDVFVNDRLLARGEVLVLNDSFCVRISEVMTSDPHRVEV